MTLTTSSPQPTEPHKRVVTRFAVSTVSAFVALALIAIGCTNETAARQFSEETANAASQTATAKTTAATGHTKNQPTSPSIKKTENQVFRDQIIAFVRDVFEHASTATCTLQAPSTTDWHAEVSAYHLGQKLAFADVVHNDLCTALRGATEALVAANGQQLSSASDIRFRVDLKNRRYSLIEFNGAGLELDHGLVPVRTFDKQMLAKRIKDGKEYLFRVLDQSHKGAHKYYYATEDRFEPRVHTIYTSSLLFTLLKLRESGDEDPRIDKHLRLGAEFILSMQERDKDAHGYGGFYYSRFTDTQQIEKKLVVGTTSKTIFTLLWLARETENATYLQAATRAADWLVRMVAKNGRVKSYIRERDGKWVNSPKESMLYSGQVLSALSRVFTVTNREHYLNAARAVASRMADKVMSEGCYVGDDYRDPNPISSSWLVLSQFDYFKATGDKMARTIIDRCARDLTTRQLDDRNDAYRHGRWRRAFSSSGNGWLAEVLSDLYLYCREHNRGQCDVYEQPIIDVTRLLMQYTYTPENAFVAKNPAAVMGGVFWNTNERYVRTDAVCHAMNAYINMIDVLPEGTLSTIPEPSLAHRLRPRATDAQRNQTAPKRINNKQ